MIRSAFLAKTAGAAATLAVAPPVIGPQTQVQQFNLGINVPLSGPLASYGNDLWRGAQAAVNETNRYTAGLTRFWGIRQFDDQNNKAVAASNVFVAAADPTIIGMIGDLTTDITLETLPQYQNASFPLVVPASTADAITSRSYHNVFRLPTKDSTEGQLFARSVLKKDGSIVRAICVEGDYGVEVARGFVAQAKADKHDADGITAKPTNDPANVAAIALKANPAYIFLAGKPDKLGPVAKALRDEGYKGDFGLSDGFFTTSATQTYGTLLSGAFVASSTPPLEKIPSIISLLQDFRADIGEVNAFSAYGYAAAQLLIAAAGRANAKNRFDLLSQLQAGGSYNLLVGQYQFNYQGDAILPNIYLYRVTEKGFDYVRPAVNTGFVL